MESAESLSQHSLFISKKQEPDKDLIGYASKALQGFQSPPSSRAQCQLHEFEDSSLLGYEELSPKQILNQVSNTPTTSSGAQPLAQIPFPCHYRMGLFDFPQQPNSHCLEPPHEDSGEKIVIELTALQKATETDSTEYEKRIKPSQKQKQLHLEAVKHRCLDTIGYA